MMSVPVDIPMAEPHALEAFFGPPNKAVDPLAPHEAFCGPCDGLADIIAGMVTGAPALVKTRATPTAKAYRLEEIQKGTPGGPYVRYGLAFMLEEGFEKTEQGRAAYKHNVEQIRNAVLDTARLGAMAALLDAAEPGYDAEGDAGTELSEERLQELVARAPPNADTVVLPTCMSALRDRFAAAFPGAEVVVAPGFQAPPPGAWKPGDAEPPEVHPLECARAGGGYYFFHDACAVPAGGAPYFREAGAVHVDGAFILLTEALAACGRFRADGSLARAVRGVGHFDEDGKLSTLPGLVPPPAGGVPPDMFLCARDGAWSLVRTVGEMHPSFTGELPDGVRETPVTLQALGALVDAGEPLPFKTMLVRPETPMASVMFIADRAATVENVIGHYDMQLAFMATRYLGNFTLYMQTVVHAPAKVFVAHNVVAARAPAGLELGSGLHACLLPRTFPEPEGPPSTWPPRPASCSWAQAAAAPCASAAGRTMCI